jgi:hypothetical protein
MQSEIKRTTRSSKRFAFVLAEKTTPMSVAQLLAQSLVPRQEHHQKDDAYSHRGDLKKVLLPHAQTTAAGS